MSTPDLSNIGISTGMDWGKIIQKQLQVYQQHHITPLQERKETWESKVSALGELQNRLSSLSSALEEMDANDEVQAFSAESSNSEVVSATASSSASAGSHSVQINQLANTEVETHAGLDETGTVVNDSGSTEQFAYTYGSEMVALDVHSGTTLEGLKEMINNDPDNPGVTASILNDGSGGTASHHLVLTGEETGNSHSITIESATTTLDGEWSALSADAASGSTTLSVNKTAPFSQYQAVRVADNDSPAEYHVVDSVNAGSVTLQNGLDSSFTTGQSALAAPRGISSAVSSSVSAGATQISVSNASNFLEGKQVVVADGGGHETATVKSVDTGTDTITLETSLSGDYTSDARVTQAEGGRDFTFDASSFTETETARSAELRVDGYPDADWIQRDSNTVSDVLDGVTLTLKQTTDGTPETITVNRDTGAMKEKATKFVEAYNKVKTFINKKTGYDEESDSAGPLMGEYVARLAESELRRVVTEPAPGFEGSDQQYSTLGQIGIETRGSASTDAKLGTLELDEEKLAEALSEDYDAVVSLLSDNFSGSSDSDYLSFYQASDDLTEPGAYDVEVDFDASGTITAARMKKTSESTFRSATVQDGYVIGKSGNPEDSLWVDADWDGSSATQSAVVRVRQGVAGIMGDRIEQMLDPTEGLVTNAQDGFNDTVESIESRITDQRERLQEKRRRLKQKYARLETLMAELQGTQRWTSSLSSTLSG